MPLKEGGFWFCAYSCWIYSMFLMWNGEKVPRSSGVSIEMIGHGCQMEQLYRTALGVKLGHNGARITLKLKYSIGQNHALEGIGFFWNSGPEITGLYEFHFDFAGAPGMKW